MSLRPALRPLPLAAVLVFSTVASAQVSLVEWNTVGLAMGGPGSLAAETAHADLAAGALTRASGFAEGVNTPHKWLGSAGSRYTSASASITANNYFTFTLTPEDGADLTISSITYVPIAAGTRSINAFQWQYSVDGAAFLNFGSSTSSTSTAGVKTDIDGADFDVLSGSTVTFRLVGWAGGSTSGSANTNWGVGTIDVGGTENDVPAIAVFGTITSAVPEPAAASALLGVAALACVAVRRRRA